MSTDTTPTWGEPTTTEPITASFEDAAPVADPFDDADATADAPVTGKRGGKRAPKTEADWKAAGARSALRRVARIESADSAVVAFLAELFRVDAVPSAIVTAGLTSERTAHLATLRRLIAVAADAPVALGVECLQIGRPAMTAVWGLVRKVSPTIGSPDAADAKAAVALAGHITNLDDAAKAIIAGAADALK